MSYKFPLGQVLMSPGVRAALTSAQLISVLRQHASGDWNPACREANKQALLDGSSLFAQFSFDTPRGQWLTIWVLTDESRTRTLLMFPRESVYRASDLEEVAGPLLHRGFPGFTPDCV
jgi:hypothetical protein